MVPAIALKDVSYRYGKRWALVRLSLEVPPGKIVLLTGRNGAGKTTLLRVLATALRPHYGTVEMLGSSPHPDPTIHRRRLALLTHQSYFYDELSSTENLKLYARLRGCDLAKIPGLLEKVGLGQDADRPVQEYSAGMKRRLGMARLLLAEPDLALLDEPFGQLDPQGVELVEGIIQELRAQGTTLVMSTHDIQRGLSLADLHLDLEGGRLVSFGEVKS